MCLLGFSIDALDIVTSSVQEKAAICTYTMCHHSSSTCCWTSNKTLLPLHFSACCIFEQTVKQGGAGKLHSVVMLLPSYICRLIKHTRRSHPDLPHGGNLRFRPTRHPSYRQLRSPHFLPGDMWSIPCTCITAPLVDEHAPPSPLLPPNLPRKPPYSSTPTIEQVPRPISWLTIDTVFITKIQV